MQRSWPDIMSRRYNSHAVCSDLQTAIYEARHFRDVFNGSEIAAYVVLGTKAFLSFLDYVGRKFTGMLSRLASYIAVCRSEQAACELGNHIDAAGKIRYTLTMTLHQEAG